jgi:catechol 2,3-dioxygenase
MYNNEIIGEETVMSSSTNPVLHHVTMKTTRPTEMMKWYDQTVGLKPNFAGEEGAWLTNDAANHRVALLVAPGLSDDPDKIAHTGMHHLAFEYPDIEGLLSTYGRLKAVGITPHACLDHGLTMSLYYVDPDGNSVELQVDNFGSWDKSSDWMRNSPEYKANPIGVNVDPERLYAAWKDGADHQELHRRCFSGEFEPSVPLDLRLPVPVASAV